MKLASLTQRKHSRIVIIPLIDVMFFLLASFMMVSLQMDRVENIKVALPFSTSAGRDFKPDMFHIAVDKAGGVWLERAPIALPELGRVLSNRFRLQTNVPVYISGDKDTLHRAMAGVLETVRNAGAQRVAFTVEEGGNRSNVHSPMSKVGGQDPADNGQEEGQGSQSEVRSPKSEVRSP